MIVCYLCMTSVNIYLQILMVLLKLSGPIELLKPLQLIIFHYIQLLTEGVLLNRAQNHGPNCQWAISLGSPQHSLE